MHNEAINKDPVGSHACCYSTLWNIDVRKIPQTVYAGWDTEVFGKLARDLTYAAASKIQEQIRLVLIAESTNNSPNNSSRIKFDTNTIGDWLNVILVRRILLFCSDVSK